MTGLLQQIRGKYSSELYSVIHHASVSNLATHTKNQCPMLKL